jgi:hypothetical protein
MNSLMKSTVYVALQAPPFLSSFLTQFSIYHLPVPSPNPRLRYIVFDTFLLIKRFSVDEYIWASVNLYLDIINLFIKILQLLGDRRD